VLRGFVMVVVVGVRLWWSGGKESECRIETVLQSLQWGCSPTELYTLHQQLSFYGVTVCCALQLLQSDPGLQHRKQGAVSDQIVVEGSVTSIGECVAYVHSAVMANISNLQYS
jgi:hypothetical protein